MLCCFAHREYSLTKKRTRKKHRIKKGRKSYNVYPTYFLQKRLFRSRYDLSKVVMSKNVECHNVKNGKCHSVKKCWMSKKHQIIYSMFLPMLDSTLNYFLFLSTLWYFFGQNVESIKFHLTKLICIYYQNVEWQNVKKFNIGLRRREGIFDIFSFSIIHFIKTALTFFHSTFRNSTLWAYITFYLIHLLFILIFIDASLINPLSKFSRQIAIWYFSTNWKFHFIQKFAFVSWIQIRCYFFGYF